MDAIFSHADLPSTLQVRHVPGRGRGVFVTADFAPGATLFSTTPLVSVLDNRNLLSRCSNCWLSEDDVLDGKPLLRCTGCKVLHYCSAKCQKVDWEAHKLECKALVEYTKARKAAGGKDADKVPDTPLRALGRILWSKAKKGESFWAEVESMQSHRTTLSSAQSEQLFQLSVSLATYVGSTIISSTMSSATALLDLCSRFTSNSFSLTSPHLSNIGVSISPLAALLNHSCSPNAVVIFPSCPTLSSPKYLRVVANLAIKKGEEVLTSYIDLGMPGRMRRKELSERYAFGCMCGLCELEKVARNDGRWVDPREAFGCAQEGCEGVGWMPNFEKDTGSFESQCNKCGAVRKVEVEHFKGVVEEAESMLARAEARQYDEPSTAAMQCLVSIAALTTNHFAPTAYPLLPTYATRLAILLHSHSWADALACARLSWNGLSGLYTTPHPARAISAAAVAKLLVISRDEGDDEAYWGDQQALRETHEVLIKALREVEGGFGKQEGVLLREMRGLTANSEEAMQHLEVQRRAGRDARRVTEF